MCLCQCWSTCAWPHSYPWLALRVEVQLESWSDLRMPVELQFRMRIAMREGWSRKESRDVDSFGWSKRSLPYEANRFILRQNRNVFELIYSSQSKSFKLYRTRTQHSEIQYCYFAKELIMWAHQPCLVITAALPRVSALSDNPHRSSL